STRTSIAIRRSCATPTSPSSSGAGGAPSPLISIATGSSRRSRALGPTPSGRGGAFSPRLPPSRSGWSARGAAPLDPLTRRCGDYSGVGTAEFLFTGDRYFFLEVNPRLQVEHGVTEAVAGIDLVELQIRIGRGEEIGDLELHESGAAIEARVCAEDPAREFLP